MGEGCSTFPLSSLLICGVRWFFPAFFLGAQESSCDLEPHASGFLRQGSAPSCSLQALNEVPLSSGGY